jgi:hypothetical protein
VSDISLIRLQLEGEAVSSGVGWGGVGIPFLPCGAYLCVCVCVLFFMQVLCSKCCCITVQCGEVGLDCTISNW